MMLSIALLLVGLVSTPPSATANDGVRDVIEQLMSGIDEQDADLISAALAEDAGIFGTAPDGASIVAVSAETFADLHASGRFGGQARSVEISAVQVTENLIAAATVVAENSSVHYTYYVGLTRVTGEWRVQTLLQRSRPADPEQ